MYALVLESSDPAATLRALRMTGLDLQQSAADPGQWQIDPAVFHGVRLRIEPRPES
jgi:hypothetical protein